MKKNKEKVTSNDVLDGLAIRLGDVLKTSRKGAVDKKNNPYFWLFKLIFLILYLIVIYIIFHETKELGCDIIYAFGKSLRSILSLGWLLILTFTEGVVMLSVIYKNVVDFMESKYFEKLYVKDKVMCKKKENFFITVKIVLQSISIVYLLIIGFVSAFMLFVAVLFIKMLLDGVYVVSPIVITLATFAICYLTFKHLQNVFFDTKPEISHTSFILAVIVLVIGVAFFGYETSGYEYKNGLPLGFDTIQKSETFDVSKVNKIIVKSDSKLDNLKVYIDNDLVDEIKIEVEYYDTAEVSYIYTFNNSNNLYLTITSKLHFGFDDLYDVAKLASATFSNSTIYNYNLFKYPNIKVYANEKVVKKISTQHN